MRAGSKSDATPTVIHQCATIDTQPGTTHTSQISEAVTSGRSYIPPAALAAAPARSYSSPVAIQFFALGVLAALFTTYALNWIAHLPVISALVRRFIWWREPRPLALSSFEERVETTPDNTAITALMPLDDDGEAVEWVNMCWRKAWRVYQRGLERWLADLLQPVFDNLVAEGMVPKFVQRMRILEFTLDHEAPYFTNMRRRSSRKDSDLTGVVDVRYTGGARMLLLIEVGTGRWRMKFPVLVSDLDLESVMWLKLRLAPMCPWVGTISLAFVGPPSIKLQLQWQSMKLRLMRIPILQAFLTKLLTVDLPGLMTLPQRLEIHIPPAVTAVAEAAVGRDAVMRAVASAVLQADALEHALIAALPLGPQGAAGGVSLPDLYQGELQVVLHSARNLPVWGLPWQSNPFVRLALGAQAVQSRKDSDTSHASRHRAPVWNQEFQFLVEDPTVQTLEIWVRDTLMTGRSDLGHTELALADLPTGGTLDMWLPLVDELAQTANSKNIEKGPAVHLSVTYKPFQDDEMDSGFREAAAWEAAQSEGSIDEEIIDIKSAADASSRAAVAASAAAAAVAVTKAAAARAAARLARRRRACEDGSSVEESVGVESTEEEEDIRTLELMENLLAGSKNGNGAATSDEQVPGQDRLNKIQQLTQMTATMQQITEEVDVLMKASPEGNGAAAAEAAAKAVAAAEALAASSIAVGDVGAANEALAAAAAALGSTATKLAGRVGGPHEMAVTTPTGDDVLTESIEGASPSPPQEVGAVTVEFTSPPHSLEENKEDLEERIDNEEDEEGHNIELSPEQRAAEALAAAEAAAARIAASLNHQIESDGEDWMDALGGLSTDDEGALGVEAGSFPVHPGTNDLPMSSSSSDEEEEEEKQPPWWFTALEYVPGVPAKGKKRGVVEEAVAEADGTAVSSMGSIDDLVVKRADRGVAVVKKKRKKEEEEGAWWKDIWPFGSRSSADEEDELLIIDQETAESRRKSRRNQPVGDIILPEEIPLDEIAAEVQKSWKLRDTHVETLVQKALEQRQKQNDRPWLVLLSVMSTASAILFALVLYRLLESTP